MCCSRGENVHCEFLVRDLGAITHETSCRALALLTLILYHKSGILSIVKLHKVLARKLCNLLAYRKIAPLPAETARREFPLNRAVRLIHFENGVGGCAVNCRVSFDGDGVVLISEVTAIVPRSASVLNTHRDFVLASVIIKGADLLGEANHKLAFALLLFEHLDGICARLGEIIKSHFFATIVNQKNRIFHFKYLPLLNKIKRDFECIVNSRHLIFGANTDKSSHSSFVKSSRLLAQYCATLALAVD